MPRRTLAVALYACTLAIALPATAQTAKQTPAADPGAKWKAECSSCHMAYPPGYLPERSWRKLMTGLDKHFGENAGLDADTARVITDYLVSNSAEKSSDRRSSRFLESLTAGATPLRITETPYFRRKHNDREISPEVWKRPKVGSPANCTACHVGAEKGDFSERSVKIPQ
jgi:diheme cytochrome c